MTDLCASDSLHHRLLKGRSDGHDFACRFHLCAERSLCIDEFIERPFREFHDDIVDGRLKASVSRTRNGVADLVKLIADSELCSNLCDRITCCLGSKRRGTGYTGVYFDHGILEALRLKRKLTVTAAFYTKGRYDIQRCRTEHLIFFIRKRYSRRNNDRVTRMYAHRIHIFHRADSDDIALFISYDFKLDLFPA